MIVSRWIGGLLAGIVAAFVLVALIEGISSAAYPPPPGLDLDDMDAMKAHVAGLPIGAFLLVLLAWAAGALGGSFVASRILPGRDIAGGVVVGGLLLLGALANLMMLPHPGWFWAVSLPLIPAAAWLGVRLARPRSRPGQPQILAAA